MSAKGFQLSRASTSKSPVRRCAAVDSASDASLFCDKGLFVGTAVSVDGCSDDRTLAKMSSVEAAPSRGSTTSAELPVGSGSWLSADMLEFACGCVASPVLAVLAVSLGPLYGMRVQQPAATRTASAQVKRCNQTKARRCRYGGFPIMHSIRPMCLIAPAGEARPPHNSIPMSVLRARFS